MCQLVVQFEGAPDERRWEVRYHPVVAHARKLLDDLRTWPALFKFDLWPDDAPVLCRGDAVRYVTLEFCPAYLDERAASTRARAEEEPPTPGRAV